MRRRTFFITLATIWAPAAFFFTWSVIDYSTAARVEPTGSWQSWAAALCIFLAIMLSAVVALAQLAIMLIDRVKQR